MSKKQPTALDLATHLEDAFGCYETYKAAAELRRLHESNKELLEALRWLAEKAYMSIDDPALINARAAIAKATGGQQ